MIQLGDTLGGSGFPGGSGGKESVSVKEPLSSFYPSGKHMTRVLSLKYNMAGNEHVGWDSFLSQCLEKTVMIRTVVILSPLKLPGSCPFYGFQPIFDTETFL